MRVSQHSKGGGGVVSNATQPHASHLAPPTGTKDPGGRVRVLRLLRPPSGSYGFHLRGGKEHGTGFFISHVESGSEALAQGLRTGDQVLRVNGVSVEGSVHREVAAMVQAKDFVCLHVRSTGIIPVKERRGDPLTWHLVEEEEETHDIEGGEDLSSFPSSTPSSVFVPPNVHSHPQFGAVDVSPTLSHSGSSGASSTFPPLDQPTTVVVINGGTKGGLGCSICKGPPERPGIFVQSVREGGVAAQGGLRAGDQILICNNTDVSMLEFQQAVQLLKTSPRLILEVVRGAGRDFIAGESSGYNSSASSVAGDATPPVQHTGYHRERSLANRFPHHDPVTKRLSAVSRHLQLDPGRGWKEIEAEWAKAEAKEERKEANKKASKSKSSNLAPLTSSKSLLNLSTSGPVVEDEVTTSFVEFDPSDNIGQSSFRPLSQSTLDLRPVQNRAHKNTCKYGVSSGNDSNFVSGSGTKSGHRIALQTTSGPHINNIVVPSAPKDEKDAVFRLERLSSGGNSQPSSLSSISPPPPNDEGEEDPRATVDRRLQQVREQQARLQQEAERLAKQKQQLEEHHHHRGFLNSSRLSTSSLVINCGSSPPSPCPPSPTPSTAGPHMSRVLIKSSPPAPPARDARTSLSHARVTLLRPSPPASPSASTGSSSGVASGSSTSSNGIGMAPRRSLSIGSLSASSGESFAWEELEQHSHSAVLRSSHSVLGPPTLPKPSLGVGTGPVIDPPHPPPPPPPSKGQQSLAAALSQELHRRKVQQTDGSRAVSIQDKINASKKERKLGHHGNAQHEQLMEEFKQAHAKMFSCRIEEESEDDVRVSSTSNVTPKASKHVSPSFSTSPQDLPTSKNPSEGNQFKSKIIQNAQLRDNKAEGQRNSNNSAHHWQEEEHSLASSTILRAPKFEKKPLVSPIKVKATAPSVPSTAASASRAKPLVTSQPWSERHGGTTKASVSPAKEASWSSSKGVWGSSSTDSSHPYTRTTQRPPKQVPQEARVGGVVPLVQINSYHSENTVRREPKKMGFLEGEEDSYQAFVEGEATTCLQKELESTLKRSNLRHHYSATVASGTTHMDPIQALDQLTLDYNRDPDLTSSDDAEPQSILKGASTTGARHLSLQKSISFGQVTTVEDVSVM